MHLLCARRARLEPLHWPFVSQYPQCLSQSGSANMSFLLPSHLLGKPTSTEQIITLNLNSASLPCKSWDTLLTFPSTILSPPPFPLLLVLIFSLLALAIALVHFIFQHWGILNQFAIPLPRIHPPRVLITCETDLGIVQISSRAKFLMRTLTEAKGGTGKVRSGR